ncbi:MAG: GNAT family N-acetyltransferase [Candidimonas sp.]|nr:GNAT family N-acetyltransferase [Candidimonas sp.]
MSRALTFETNRATAAQIETHLLACDAAFIPPLSERLSIQSFAQKIATCAVRFEAWSGGVLIGLLAVYCNNVVQRRAFITSVSVDAEWRGKDIAQQLLETAVNYVESLAFRRIDLEVDYRNARALNVYSRIGFLIERTELSSLFMYLELKCDIDSKITLSRH